MIRWLVQLMVLLILPVQAWGQAAQVISGDHPDFTRIVVQYDGPVDWHMGRTLDGYELRLMQGRVPYDLTKAFDLIQKERLAAIWTDPQSGALHFSIACACFAIPFEFRPGTIVVDIRNGTPPKGSAFEQALDGGSVAELTDIPTSGSQARPYNGPVQSYNWTSVPMRTQPGPSALVNSSLVLPVDKPKPDHLDLEPLRQSLIVQLSEGASAGIVDMAKPKTQVPDGAQAEPIPSVEVRGGDEASLIFRQKGEQDAPMTATGDACFTDEQVNLPAWYLSASLAPEASAAPASPDNAAVEALSKQATGEPAVGTSVGGPMQKEPPISMQFAPAMANLTGEFDRPDAGAVKRAVRFDLFIGFGAEARALLRAFPIEEEDKPIWESMARIADEEPDPNPVFTGMEACDTAAAFWAVMADPKVLGIGQVQKSAVLRAFSALPAHLRQHFGPTLVDRFLAMQDFGTATALRDAVTRGAQAGGADVEMMQAAIEKASGSPGASVARLEAVASESGPSNADALVALVLQRAELGQDVSYDQVRAIEEYAKEREGSEDHEKYQQALTLAFASSGDFDNAFANLPNGPNAADTLWKLLGNAGPDSAVLNYATLQDGQEPPRSAKASASLIADRMLRLGFADQARHWAEAAIDPPALLEARIAVANNEPKQALSLLGNQKTPAAIQVRLDALNQMGDETAIAKLFADLGMTKEHWNAVSRTQDWQSLAADGPDIWKAAAVTLNSAPEPTPAPPTGASASFKRPYGPLAQGKALIDQSAATRDAIAALLSSVKSPAIPPQ